MNRYRRIAKETWAMDEELIKWLNEHFKVFKKEASKHVDLTFNKYKYKKKTYTKEEMLDRLIEITDELLEVDFIDSIEQFEKLQKQTNEMYDLLKIFHWNMGW